MAMGDGRAYVCESCERSYSDFQSECECGGRRFTTFDASRQEASSGSGDDTTLHDRESAASVGQAVMRMSFTITMAAPRVVVNSCQWLE
jgi:hypothetical protein